MRRRRAAFSLVELLIVVGIIAALVGLLLPVVTSARESARRVQCASNLRSVGTAVYVFAHAHHGRVPESQNTPKTGGGSVIPNWMYTRDYFELLDEYNAAQKMFICPSGPTAEKGPSSFPYGEGSELAARISSDSLPADPKPVSQGDPDLTRYWMGFDYQWMGRNIQETLAPGGDNPNGAPFEVTTLTRPTWTGTAVDVNPPLMADMASYKTDGTYEFTHGKRWRIPSMDPTTSLSPWCRGTASAHVGDIKINVLYRDGHVDLKTPDRQAYFSSGDTFYFR